MNKYEITDEANPVYQNCRRIRALRDIPEIGVKAGDLGGFVESEKNLSQEGNCWIFDEAIAMDNSRVLENAQLVGSSMMCWNSLIDGNAKIQRGDNSQMG